MKLRYEFRENWAVREIWLEGWLEGRRKGLIEMLHVEVAAHALSNDLGVSS